MDAELETAHTAGEQNLRQVDQAGAEDTDQKGRAGNFLRDRAVAGIAEPTADRPSQARELGPCLTAGICESVNATGILPHRRARARWSKLQA